MLCLLLWSWVILSNLLSVPWRLTVLTLYGVQTWSPILREYSPRQTYIPLIRLMMTKIDYLFWSSPSIHLFWHQTELNRSHKQSYTLRHASSFHSFCGIITKLNIKCRADSRFAPSRWETALLCNDVSYWLGANLESTLEYAFPICHKNIIQNNRVELSPARLSALCKLTHIGRANMAAFCRLHCRICFLFSSMKFL